MTDIAIAVRNVSKCYRVFDDQRSRLLHALWPKSSRGVQEVWALKDINFEIRRGEAVAIIGRNGGGKSTLLEILTGTLAATTGEVQVNGRVSALLELGSGFNPEYSGRDNVILNGLLLGLSKADILSRFAEIEAFAEIGIAIDRPVKTYSSGMMMRLAFAVQVLCDPDILIIDEALSVGDFFFQQKCLGYIRELRNRGVTLLFVSHDMGTVRDLCPRAIYLKQGTLSFDGAGTDAISRFFNEKSTTVESAKQIISSQSLPANNADKDEVQHHFEHIKRDAVWASSHEVDDGKIVAVALYNETHVASTSFKLGKKMTVRVLFKPDPKYQNHISMAICDKYGAIRNVAGSLLLKIQGVSQPKYHVFELVVDLMLEAAEYSLMINLGYEMQKNRGVILDEAKSIGPINVTWDYENDLAPFLGQVGLPVQGRFLNGVL